MNTTIINLFAGPGTGKSTVAAGVFHFMKLAGMNVELVTEFAKDLTWAERSACLQCQPYVFGKQYYKLFRLINKVDYIITDSPILLSIVYNKSSPPSFNRAVIDIFNGMNNWNFYLKRGTRPYNEKGRSQTLKEAEKIDEEIVRALLDNGIPVTTITSDVSAAEKIFQLAIDKS